MDKAYIERLIMTAEQEFGVDAAAIRALPARTPQHDISRARHCVWYVLRARGMFLTDIARVWGGNHTSVYYGVNRIQEEAALGDPQMLRSVRVLMGVPRSTARLPQRVALGTVDETLRLSRTVGEMAAHVEAVGHAVVRMAQQLAEVAEHTEQMLIEAHGVTKEDEVTAA